MESGENTYSKTGQDAFRNTMSNTDAKGKYKHVYATRPQGKYYTIRTWLSYFYLALFLGMPFIKINGLPLLEFNFPKGRFIVFSKIFWPQDFFVFAVGMIAAVVFIAIFTVIFGRLFCGWVCPQTIFMEMFFRKIEWAIEGKPSEQKRLNAASWTTEKITKKLTKHILFYLFSLLITASFLSYIIGIDELFYRVQNIEEYWMLLLGMFIFASVFYAVFAFVRDVVCTTICPYGRLQSVLFDKDTMQVAYDYKRGEPRGKAKKQTEQQLGDCVDCNKCVVVCPTGIDIRNGVQMECVGCTACIDACDDIMLKLNREPGLIRYASENQIAEGKKFHLSFKVKGYSFILSLLLGLIVYLLVSNKTVDTSIAKARGQSFTEIENNKVLNLYEVKILNKGKKERPFEIKIENIKNAQVKIVGNKPAILKPESINEFNIFIEIDKNDLPKRKTELKVGIYSDGTLLEVEKANFLGPFKEKK